MLKSKYLIALSSVLATLGVALGYFALMGGTIGANDLHPRLTQLGFNRAGFLALGCFSIGIFLAATQRRLPRLNPTAWASVVLCFLLSDWLLRGYNFFQGPSIRGELLLCGTGLLLILGRFESRALTLLLPISALIMGGAFILKTSPALLFSDDLATFMYRFQMLKERFPHIPFYNPQWNGGIDQRDFFATGALNAFLITAPIVYLFDVFKVFNWIVGALLFVLTPGATYLATRALGQPRLVGSIAATISMATGLLWYRWGMAYGTLGFISSTALLPLFLAWTTHFITPNKAVTLSKALGFVAVTTLMLFWSPSGLVAIPAIACCLFYIKTVLSKKHSITAAIFILLLNLPWILTFWSVSKVGSFIHPEINKHEILERDVNSGSDTDDNEALTAKKNSRASVPQPHLKHKTHPPSPATSLTILREAAVSSNPFLLIMIPLGLAALAGRTRVVYIGTALWLVILGCIIAPHRPQLELDRMLVILTVIGAVPSAIGFANLLHLSQKAHVFGATRLVTAAVGSFLVLSPFAVTNFLEQRTLVRYQLASDTVSDLVAAIKEHGGEGRTLFSGFVLHELSGGHLAPLTVMTGKPLMASSHVHNLWHYKQIFPDEFINQKDSGIDRYLELYNVTAVIAHEKVWKEYFRSRPESFTESWRRDRFALFVRRGAKPNFFLSGDGSLIAQDYHSVTVKLATPEAILKFNYLPFLESTACKISGAPQADEVTLIRLSNCPLGTPITIQSKGVIARLLEHS